MKFLKMIATPTVMGAFLLSGTTGVLMFFDAETPFNKRAHEMFGWAMVLGVFAHVATNWPSFKLYFSKTRKTTFVIVGAFAAILAGSFYNPPQAQGPSPARLALNALATAPLTAVAAVAGQSPENVVQALAAAGFKPTGPNATIREIAGDDREAQAHAYEAIFHR